MACSPRRIESSNHRKTIGKPQENDGFMGFNGMLYLAVIEHSELEKLPFIVDFPDKSGDFPWLCQITRV